MTVAIRPYPGLRPFSRDEDFLFFGRERQTDELLEKLGQTHFIAVLGTSGSGKSSLVRAGMLPALVGGFLASAGARWEIAELRPGGRPIERLAQALVGHTAWGRSYADSDKRAGSGTAHTDPLPERSTASAASPQVAQAAAALEQDLRRGSMALNWLLGVRPLAEDSRLLILVDQFEELFRFADQGDEETRAVADRKASAFAALLLAAARYPAVYVVITMRSDFLGDCARHRGLPEAVNAGLYLTLRLDAEQMADAVRLPARVCGGEVEPALVERLLEVARGEMDQLPLLQHALMRLWDLDDGDRRLTLAELEGLGGLPQALNDHAEEAFGELTGQQPAIAEALFRSLTERGPEQRDTRRPVRLGDVSELAGASIDEVIVVAERFRTRERSFLMPPADEELDADKTLDITHEALIRQWQRLAGWTAAEADQAEIYRRLESDARRERDLWTGANLGLARPWLEDREHTRRWALRYSAEGEKSVELALQFLHESAAAEDARSEQAEARRRRELRRARYTAIVSAIALAFMTALAGWAWLERRHAQEAEDEARHHEALAESVEKQRTRDLFDSKVTHAALLARTEDYAKAKEVLAGSRELDDKIPATRRVARDLLTRYAQIMGGAAEQVYEGAGAKLFSVAVSPDGLRIAASGEYGNVVLFDAESGELVQRLEGHEPDAGTLGDVWDLVFQPGGDWLASAGDDRRIILWSLTSADGSASKLRDWEAPGQVTSLAISPDGSLLASGGTDNAITLWDTETGKDLRTLEGHQARISTNSGLAFSPDGSRLASASYDSTARIWDVETGVQQARLTRHRGRAQGVAFSVDGSLGVTSGEDRQVILWDLEAGTPVGVFGGHRNGIWGVGFAARPSEPSAAPLLVAAGFDRTIRIWDSDSAVTQRLLQGHEAGVAGMAIWGDAVFSAANDGTVRRWSLTLPHQRLLDLPGEPLSAAVSPNGGSVAVGFADGAIKVLNLPDLEEIAGRSEAHKGKIYRLAFSADGSQLASAGFDDKLAHLWRIGADGAIEKVLDLTGHENAVYDVAFSPDGGTVATAGYDGRVGIFDSTTGRGDFIESTQGRTMSVAFDPTGTRILSGDTDDGKVRIWDIEVDPPALIREIQATSDLLHWAELAAGGMQLAAVGRDFVLNVLDSETGEPLNRLPGHEQAVFKARFLPGGRQVATASTDATVRFGDLDTKSQPFALRLPTNRAPPAPLWDFDLRCAGRGGDAPSETDAGGDGAGSA